VLKNIMSNGNMEYGDGGWYLWNKPEGPAKVEFKIAEPKIGVMVLRVQ
jgi:endo-1,4-beta-xylanase